MRFAALFAALLFSAAPPLFAHHSAAAEYVAEITILKATVVRVDWMNPHVWFFLDVSNANGTVTHWECEGSSPNGLLSNGWRKDSLKPGDRVTVECSKAKDRPDVCKIRAVTLADGRRLAMGSTAPN